LPASTAGKKVEVLTDEFQLVESTNAAPPAWQLDLTRGTYLVQILADGSQKVFDVTGIGDVNVNI